MSALVRAKQQVEEARLQKSTALKRIREAAKASAEAQEHTAIAAGAAWGIGRLEKNGTAIPTVRGIDPKLMYGIGALAGAYLSKSDRSKRILQSAGDGLIGAWAYAQGKGASVAGVSGVPSQSDVSGLAEGPDLAGYGAELLGHDGGLGSEEGEI